MVPYYGAIKLPVWYRKMASFFTGAILKKKKKLKKKLLDIEHVLFPSNKLLVRLVRHVT